MFKTSLTTIIAIANLIWTNTPVLALDPLLNISDAPLSNEVEVKLLPDFTRISLGDLGIVEQNGFLGDHFNPYADYDVSRVWQAGDTLDRILKLGDLEDKIAPQEFLVEDIFQLSTLIVDFPQLSLSSFPLLNKQTLSELVVAIPQLGSEPIHHIPPVQSLIQQEYPGYDLRGRLLSQVVSNPSIGDLSLDMLPTQQLDGITLQQIPHLETAQLKNFADWKSSFFSEVPGLAQVPLADFPLPVSPVGNFIGRVDWIWGSAESDRTRTISGSYLEGFNVPCQTACAHLELDDLENWGVAASLPFEGSQWISGLYQQVMGGSGCLIGLEPTGIHPFGDTFKLVLWNTDEATDTANVVLFFNFKTLCGESPYVIGPVVSPWSNLRNNDWIFLGPY